MYKKIVFLFCCSVVTIFAETPSRDILDKMVANAAVQYLKESDRVNPKAIKAIRVSVVRIGKSNIYNTSVSINEIGCLIVFMCDFLIQNVSDGWDVRVLSEYFYNRKWRKEFLLSFRGPSELVEIDQKSLKDWKDPEKKDVLKIFLDLIKQDFQVDSSRLKNPQIESGKICKKFVFIQGEKIEVCLGRMVMVKAGLKKGIRKGDHEIKPVFEATLFFYEADGKWSADLLGQVIKNSISKKIEI